MKVGQHWLREKLTEDATIIPYRKKKRETPRKKSLMRNILNEKFGQSMFYN